MVWSDTNPPTKSTGMEFHGRHDHMTTVRQTSQLSMTRSALDELASTQISVNPTIYTSGWRGRGASPPTLASPSHDSTTAEVLTGRYPSIIVAFEASNRFSRRTPILQNKVREKDKLHADNDQRAFETARSVVVEAAMHGGRSRTSSTTTIQVDRLDRQEPACRRLPQAG